MVNADSYVTLVSSALVQNERRTSSVGCIVILQRCNSVLSDPVRSNFFHKQFARNGPRPCKSAQSDPTATTALSPTTDANVSGMSGLQMAQSATRAFFDHTGSFDRFVASAG